MNGTTAWNNWGATLAISLDREFERVCLPFLRLLWPEMTIPKPLSKWDRQGIDLVAFGEGSKIACVGQCKTSQEKVLGSADVRQAEESILKFQNSGHTCETYLLLINGDGRSIEYTASVNKLLRALVESGVAERAELWDRQKLLNNAFGRMKYILLHALRIRSQGRRDLFRELFRFGSVYLPDVPVQEEELILKPGAPCERRSVRTLATRVLADLLQDCSSARWTLLTGLFGAGKTTSALQASSVGERTAIFVSAAELGEGARKRGTYALSQDIVDCLRLFECGAEPIDGFRIMEQSDEGVFEKLAGPALRSLLRSEDAQHVLILDGLDENSAYLSPGGFQVLNNQLADVKCPIVLTTRFEHLSSMFGNFESLLEGLGTKRRCSQPARLLSLAPWTPVQVRHFIEQAIKMSTDEEGTALTSLLIALDDGTLQGLYGDLPFHPLFLQFILDDICSTGFQRRGRAELIEGWIVRKIGRDIDHHGILLEEPVDRFEWIGRMLLLMEAVAGTMTSGTTDKHLAEYLDAAEIESLSAAIFGKRISITVLLLFSVMTPRTVRRGTRLDVRFSLRLLQEYFLARHLKRTDSPSDLYPESVRALERDIAHDFQQMRP